MRNNKLFIPQKISRCRALLQKALLACFCIAFFTSCENMQKIITGVNEREANMIVVLLESKGIKANKSPTTISAAAAGAEQTSPKFDIMVNASDAIQAMAFLNKNGLPKQKGTNLLQLFQATGLMTSDKEETIRYQAGLAEQLNNMLMMIDGVIDSSVQLSFPPQEAFPGEEAQKEKITAAVYVKHQGVLDDPNNHLEDKIKRLVSGSVTGLDINDVTVVSDRSRFTDISVEEMPEAITAAPKEYVSIWNIVMNKESAARFRFLFFFLIFFALVFALLLGWLIWKFYPILKKRGGFKQLLSPVPVTTVEKEKETPPKEEK